MEKPKSKKDQKMDRSLISLKAITGFVYAHERNLPEPSWIRTILFEKFKIYLDSNFSFPDKNPKSLDEAFGLYPSSLENALNRERNNILAMNVCVLKEILGLKSFDRAIDLVLAFEGQTREEALPSIVCPTGNKTLLKSSEEVTDLVRAFEGQTTEDVLPGIDDLTEDKTLPTKTMRLRRYPTPIDDAVESILAADHGGLDWIRWGIPLHWFLRFESENFRTFFFKQKKELAPSIKKIKDLSTELKNSIRQQFSDWAKESKNGDFEDLILSRKKPAKS